ncbi:hypothetical protein GOV04_04620 [Candidatus Woesearchaeota archaeon]|nr:hypothetical protein [Candidatus Woesearchaeota archaeon]
MTDDDYELISHKEIAELRKQITEMKGGKTASPASAQSAEPSTTSNMEELLEQLNTNITTMLAVFKEAGKNLEEGQDTVGVEIIGKLDTVIEQNKKIAKGIVTVADMIKDSGAAAHAPSALAPMPQAPMPSAQPQSPLDNFQGLPGQAPQQGQQPGFAPFPTGPQQAQSVPPPVQPPKPDRKGLFDKFK